MDRTENDNTQSIYGTFYRPPNSSPSAMTNIENSIAFDANISNIIITADFNFDI